MPGSQSHLDRHEWTKHGTCYPGRDPEAYFQRFAPPAGGGQRLAGAGAHGCEASGREVAADEIRARFDEAFGAGAGERVRVACKDDGTRRLIAELTIGLKGDIPGGTPVADLILASAPTDPGCPGGIVDPVGLQ